MTRSLGSVAIAAVMILTTLLGLRTWTVAKTDERYALAPQCILAPHEKTVAPEAQEHAQVLFVGCGGLF